MAAKKKEILSQDFIRRIIEFSGGYFNKDQLTEFFSLIENETDRYYFTRTSESNLLRFISAAYDKVSFLADCLKYPHYIELLISITANSNYLTDILVRNPEYFYTIANPSYLENIYGESKYIEGADSAVNVFTSFASKVNALRRYKRKEILRIGAKDIFLKKDIREITSELSFLARAITSRLFSLCYDFTLNKYGLNLSEKRYCLFALGKLGGNELNYSSDIDLMIFYDKNEVLSNNREFQEILTEAVLLFIESSSSVTENGYIYRTDFRLRPDGKNSPLCKSLSDYLVYYESRGEDWERQMLIKSSFISGNYELFRKFKDFLTPFIYPASFKTSPLDQIRRLKMNIERNLRSDENIKLVPGGIRDIEFTVQALQLINGGRLESLRRENTLIAIDELKNNRLFSGSEKDIFNEAYSLYRRIEHYLQLMNDTQTHKIPSGGELLDKLSCYLGYKKNKDFLQSVDISREKVSGIYKSVIGKEKHDYLKNSSSDIRFNNSRNAERDLSYLREGKGLLGNREFDKHSIEAFDKISSMLLKYLRNSNDPDQVIKNFVRVIRYAKFPSIWYDAFRDKKFFNAFLHICEYSQSSVDIFAEDKSLRDLFLSKKIFDKITVKDNISYKTLGFMLSVQFSLGMLKSDKVSRFLSEYFYVQIDKLSKPLDQNHSLSDHYFIGAMGSFGSGEMTFSSDIDLIFITDNLSSYHDEQNIFIDYLNTLREEFRPVTVDCRLRPEGKSGMLVWDLAAYVNYIAERARIWELQALTKLSFVKGDRKIYTRIRTAVVKRLNREKMNSISTGLIAMRRKKLSVSAGFTDMINLKRSAGGITDIEFILQYLILCNPHLYKKLSAKRVSTVITGLIKNYPEYADSLMILNKNHRFLKSLLLYYQDIFHQTGSMIVKEDLKFRKLAVKMGLNSGSDLEKEVIRVMKENSSLFKKVIG